MDSNGDRSLVQPPRSPSAVLGRQSRKRCRDPGHTQCGRQSSGHSRRQSYRRSRKRSRSCVRSPDHRMRRLETPPLGRIATHLSRSPTRVQQEEQLSENGRSQSRRSRSNIRNDRRTGDPRRHRDTRSPSKSTSARESFPDMFSKLTDVLDKISSRGSERISNFNVVPEFDPSSKNQNINNWIHKVNEIGNIYSWTDRQIIHNTIPKLTRNAKRWYEGLATVNYSWVEWQEKLKAAFPSDENYGQMLSDMLDKRAKFGESLEDYYYDKIALLNMCEIKGKRAVECVIFGIDDRAIRIGAEAAQFINPDKLLAYLRNAKSIGTKRSDNVQRTSNKKFPTDDKQPGNRSIRCYNCKEEGHAISKCTKPIKKCTICTKMGHESNDCYRKKEDAKAVLEA